MFRLQISYPDGTVAQMPGGGPLEREFVETCVKAIIAKGVGFGRTSTHVEQDIRDGIIETINALKWDSRFAALG